MNLSQETKTICKQYNIIPSRSKGQNFLINEIIYDKMVDVAKLSKKDTVIEIGPGLGILTRKLYQKANNVIAIELDQDVYKYLKIAKELEKLENLELRNEDVLKLQSDTLPPKYKIVANLPYNITSIFLRQFLTLENKPQEMILMLQKEVAERIISKPGQMSRLAISVQFYADAKIIEYVPRENFWPQPNVDSAIIKIKSRDKYTKQVTSEKDFFRIVKIGFSAKRKKLANNLANGLHKKQSEILPILQKMKLNDNIRAQELSIENWINLTQIIKQP